VRRSGFRARALGACAALAALAGCPASEGPDRVELLRLTSAPPAGRASIVSRDGEDREIYEIELSLGAAVAARCWDTCEPDSPCTLAKLAAEDPAILGIRPVYRAGNGDGEFVLFARGAGTTTLRVQASCTSQTYEVKVLRP
jgi:hypothetical protein